MMQLRPRAASGFFLIALVATVVLGCASTPDDSPASTSVRRVFLSKTQEAGGYSYQSDVGLGTPTDRFEAELERGYLYIVFNDNRDHTAQFRVTNTETGRTTSIQRSRS